jgi:hypothetical protein
MSIAAPNCGGQQRCWAAAAYRESWNVTRKRLISAFRPPAPDMDSTSTEDNVPTEANAAGNHGNCAQTSSRLLLALSGILMTIVQRCLVALSRKCFFL